MDSIFQCQDEVEDTDLETHGSGNNDGDASVEGLWVSNRMFARHSWVGVD